ncbi:MAG: hypothetical protein JOY81_14910 [Alphaproteobacteria bacterium]|nr:hypothetical protein [Alphaproteobacteria bacterium]
MIRTVICTVAVLAGFAVVESTSDASTGLAGSCKTTEAYAMLHPGEQLPVRNSPSPEGTVLGALATQRMDEEIIASTVTLTGSQNGWARIALNSNDYTAVDGNTQRYGWIPADTLAVSTGVHGKVTVYTRPGWLGQVAGQVENENQKFRLLGCNSDMLQVINAQFGSSWIDRWCAKAEGCRS